MPEPLFVDYHCHLDLYPDYEAQFGTCTTKRIATLAATTTPQAWPRNKELAARSPLVRVGLGLHPQLAAERKSELSLFEKYLPETRHVAEVGLDAGPTCYRSYPEQKEVFETILRLCASATGKILSVHAVRACGDVLKLVEKHLAGTDNRVVLHWFSGSTGEARRAAALGCYFSINHLMLGKPTAKALLDALPKERLLTETDGPFTKIGNRSSVPADVLMTVKTAASLLDTSEEEMRGLLLRNLADLERAARVG